MAKRFDVSTMTQEEVELTLQRVATTGYERTAKELDIGRGTLFDALAPFRSRIQGMKAELKAKALAASRQKPSDAHAPRTQSDGTSKPVNSTGSNGARVQQSGMVDQKPSQSPSGEKPTTANLQVVEPLSPQERHRLAELESIIRAKLKDFFEVGSAIMEIKIKQLYRDTHPNFHDYCQEKFGIGRSYANKLIGSAERIQLLPAVLPRPANEFQIRPFLDLPAEEFPKKWEEIVRTVGPGEVTYKVVERALGLPTQQRKRRRTKPSRIKTLLSNIRVALKERRIEVALSQLDELQKLLEI